MDPKKTIPLKKLILIRHAKSSWKYNVSDIDRPLSNQGFDDILIMSEILRNLKIKIDVCFSSPAKRALDTGKNILKNLHINNELMLIKKSVLYDFEGTNTKNFIKSIKNDFSSALIFSHNNTCSNLLNQFSKYSNIHVPTCGIIIFEFDVSLWKEIKKGECKYFFPKNFK